MGQTAIVDFDRFSLEMFSITKRHTLAELSCHLLPASRLLLRLPSGMYRWLAGNLYMGSLGQGTRCWAEQETPMNNKPQNPIPSGCAFLICY
jgi:hypothetical protein